MPAFAAAALPDPMPRGSYNVGITDPVKAGLVDLQEPSASGTAPAGASAAATVQLRGSLYYPTNKASDSPIIVLVHGNHGSCQSGSAPNCTVFKRNDRGYAYLGENLASQGYTVFSIDQDQLIYYQDGTARGMHQRRLIIAATLDALYKANQAAIPDDANNNIGATLVGKLDFSRIGMMGHSRGGDAVTSFIDFNRTRPAPGRRYPGLRGVIALAPTDYERRAPWGVAHLSVLPACDGDVSNLMGTRFYERGQYVRPDDPFPRIQEVVHGTNHNYFNSTWFVDGDDSTTNDPACGTRKDSATNDTNIRLSGGYYKRADSTVAANQGPDSYGSGDPSLMGDQEKVGLALMSEFFRRYVGSELDYDPYMTGEVSQDGVTPQLPASACPSQQYETFNPPVTAAAQLVKMDGTRIPCIERMMTSYFAPPAERMDVIGPEPDDPLNESALGTAIVSSGFANPFTATGFTQPQPAKTATGLDWCNPEPNHFTPSAVGEAGLPTAAKPCPLPGVGELGHQQNTRENAPVNHSYGLQYSVAWEDPVANTGQPAKITTRIPSADRDVSDFKSLAFGAGVNYVDTRNPSRGTEGLWNPAFTTQDFTIAVTDRDGNEATVNAGNQKYGNALHQSVGNTATRMHVILNEIRVPLTEFSSQGVDIENLKSVELRFGEAGKPLTGSIQLADIRFQESAGGPSVRSEAAAYNWSKDTIESTPRDSLATTPDVITVTDAKPGAACSPLASIKSVKKGKRKLKIKGKAAVGTCASAASAGSKKTIRAVEVTISKPAGKLCRFVKPDGKLSKPMPCDSPVALVAKGKSDWTLKLGGKTPKGKYAAVVRAIDSSGTRQAIGKPKTIRIGG